MKVDQRKIFLVSESDLGGSWTCGFGTCKRRAVYIVVQPKVENGFLYMSHKGGCRSCATKYARRYELRLPDEKET